MDDLDFTEEEIREQLENLGYHDVPPERLTEFKRDLEQLMKHEKSRNNSWSTCSESSSARTYTTGTDSSTMGNGAQWRPPLDETNNRQPYMQGVNKSRVEHARFGKENVQIYNDYQMMAPNAYQKFNGVPVHSRQPIHIPVSVLDLEEEEDSKDHEDEHHVDSDYMSPREDRERMFSVIAGGVGRTVHFPEQERVTETNGADDSLNTTSSTERRQMKRKVLRKRDGQVHVFDESVTETDDTDLSGLHERLQQLRIPEEDVPYEARRPWSAREPPSQTYNLYVKRPQSAGNAPCYRLPDDFEGPKALIRPMTSNPHTKNLRKSDPVARYQQYQQSWNSQRAPGEKTHKSLRWNVREQMLYHDEVVQKKQHKVFVPNNYVVPSDKRRKKLRWQIRNDLAQGVKPPSVFD